MEVLWGLPEGATVSDVVETLPKHNRPAYNTVLTMLRILERKGYLKHQKRGRAFVYRPIVGREQARRRSVKHLLSRFFDDSPGALLLNVIENEEIDADELARLRRLIDNTEKNDTEKNDV